LTASLSILLQKKKILVSEVVSSGEPGKPTAYYDEINRTI
jgi:hypothetical protein